MKQKYARFERAAKIFKNMQLRREYDYLMYQAINKDMRKEIKRILR